MPGFGQSDLLSLRKTALRLRIAQRRAQLQADLDEVAAPLYQADAWLGRVQRLRFLWPVLQAVWLGARGGAAEAARKPFAGLRKLARWAPVAMKIFRAARGAHTTYAARDE
jgi:hypothetical protein